MVCCTSLSSRQTDSMKITFAPVSFSCSTSQARRLCVELVASKMASEPKSPL